jgi:hypothetical protein
VGFCVAHSSLAASGFKEEAGLDAGSRLLDRQYLYSRPIRTIYRYQSTGTSSEEEKKQPTFPGAQISDLLQMLQTFYSATETSSSSCFILTPMVFGVSESHYCISTKCVGHFKREGVLRATMD